MTPTVHRSICNHARQVVFMHVRGDPTLRELALTVQARTGHSDNQRNARRRTESNHLTLLPLPISRWSKSHAVDIALSYVKVS